MSDIDVIWVTTFPDNKYPGACGAVQPFPAAPQKLSAIAEKRVHKGPNRLSAAQCQRRCRRGYISGIDRIGSRYRRGEGSVWLDCRCLRGRRECQQSQRPQCSPKLVPASITSAVCGHPTAHALNRAILMPGYCPRQNNALLIHVGLTCQKFRHSEARPAPTARPDDIDFKCLFGIWVCKKIRRLHYVDPIYTKRLSRSVGCRSFGRAARVPAGCRSMPPKPEGRARGCARGHHAVLDLSRRPGPTAVKLRNGCCAKG